MSLVGRAVFLSLMVHVVLLGTIAWLPGNREPETAGGSYRDMTIVVLDDSPPATELPPRVPPEPARPFVPVLLEPPNTLPVSLPTPEAGPIVSPATDPHGPSVTSPRPAPAARPAWLPTEPAGRAMVYLLDRSISMSLTGSLAPARRELRSCLESLPATCRFQVIPYSRLAEPLILQGRQDLMPATPELVRAALTRVDQLYGEGGTEPLRALKRALLLRPDVIYLLTDGFNLPEGTPDELTRLNHGRAAIHILELVRSTQVGESTAAVRLTQRNGGTYRRIPLP